MQNFVCFCKISRHFISQNFSQLPYKYFYFRKGFAQNYLILEIFAAPFAKTNTVFPRKQIFFGN
jgi:hypothetical protein